MRKLKATDADFGNKPESAFSFLAAKIAVCPMIAQGGPSDWLAEKKSSSQAAVFFLAKPCRQSRTNRQHIQQEIKTPILQGGLSN
ncbi:hypothetical protein GGR06_003567 [Bacteroides reticulotermitis]|uniref:Uncharacterized protein n=1 Tax=Bacteroides reticulotermitis TaxID=1133319 RepID=A0A840DAS3_9BACE|nr:hypothetical protein [Bacteroides reticulotermitis]MBB4045745.1 hypothetical protein [Bacteroides reticulotermitis]